MINLDIDEELALGAAQGDAQSFRALLQRHYDRTYRVVYSVVRAQTEAEDITQEIWAGIPVKLRGWRGEAKFSSWLHRIAINAAKDSLRKTASRARMTAGYAEMQSLSREEGVETQKQLSWLQSALETLSEDLRSTAALTLGEQMSFADAAKVLGVAEGTIAWRMSEIRRKLKTRASHDNLISKEAQI